MKPTLYFFLLFPFFINAQISGKVVDENGEALSFANIYIQNSTTGTSSNLNGEYMLPLSNGKYKLVFHYVGYKQKVEQVHYQGSPILLNVQLEREAVNLQAVEVKANAEDPAYAIIRKAIAKRDYYKKLVDAYQCDVYIKGNHRIVKAPEKIMGRDIGNMGGILDSTGQGIIYLSESQSEFFKTPNSSKEFLLYSKVSGNDNGFSFNRARDLDFDFYDNHFDVIRPILSPIADNALQYYKYKLEGTFFDENGFLINKIKIIKKRPVDPVVSGYIYIVEDKWNIQSANLAITGAAVKNPILDTLWIKQVHVPIDGTEKWMVFSQQMTFDFEVFKLGVAGSFVGVYTNYELNPDQPSDFTNREVFKVGTEANSMSLAHWDTLRPIPLTEEEELDYVKKDSLQTVWQSEAYVDSLDKELNKFKPLDILFGYDYQNTKKRFSVSIPTPLLLLQANPVQGYHTELNVNIRKRLFKNKKNNITFNNSLNYGFSDKKFRYNGSLRYYFDYIHHSFVKVEGGLQEAVQFGNRDVVSPFLNTASVLFFHKNFIHLYEKDYVKLSYQREIFNGIFSNISAMYSDRSFISENSFDNSFFYKDRTYLPNWVVVKASEGLNDPYQQNKVFISNLGFRIRFKQEYASYPTYRYLLESDYPEIFLNFTKAWKVDDTSRPFEKITATVKDDFSLGLKGFTEWRASAGTFLGDKDLYFMDYHHFNGNRMLFVNASVMLKTFANLPYYELSTNENWVEAHVKHHFNGYILDKIPLLRKLNFNSTIGAAFVKVKGQDIYWEWSAGLDNIGLGFFKILNLDVVSSYSASTHRETRVIISLDL